MNYFDNKEKTYYLKEIPGVIKKNDLLEKEYNNQTGFFGNKLISNPYLSDQAKLSVIETVKPQYKKEINIIKKTLPYVKKAQDIHKKFFSNKDNYAEEQYKQHLTNLGGKKSRRKKSKLKKKKSTKRRRLRI